MAKHVQTPSDKTDKTNEREQKNRTLCINGNKI